jgi:monoamine oxidase
MASGTDCDVIIVGAGAAGLAACRELERAGIETLVLEAKQRIGGRVFTVYDPLIGLPIELGAEFIHGRPAEIWDIVHDAQLTVYDGTDESRYMNNGELVTRADAWEVVDPVIDEMRQAAAKEPDQSFDQFLESRDYSEAAKQAARGFVEGFNAADSSEISIQALAEETRAADEIDGDRIFRVVNGYEAVTQHIARAIPRLLNKLRLNSVVENIAWQEGGVSAQVRNRLNRVVTYRARRAIVTVPLGVLQAGAIQFSPEPTELLNAAKSLRFGQVYRLVLEFHDAFWEKNEALKDVGFILSREELFPAWWTSLAARSRRLTAWSAGRRARTLKGQSSSALLETALQSLAKITGEQRETICSQLASMHFHDWEADPFARGAYSYVPVGALAARRRLGGPVKDTLYFAGEATDQGGHSATVHGAIASGIRAAQQILGSR